MAQIRFSFSGLESKPLVWSGMEAHAFNSSIREPEAGRSLYVPGQGFIMRP